MNQHLYVYKQDGKYMCSETEPEGVESHVYLLQSAIDEALNAADKALDGGKLLIEQQLMVFMRQVEAMMQLNELALKCKDKDAAVEMLSILGKSLADCQTIMR